MPKTLKYVDAAEIEALVVRLEWAANLYSEMRKERFKRGDKQQASYYFGISSTSEDLASDLREILAVN